MFRAQQAEVGDKTRMKSTSTGHLNLLTEAPAGRHFAQLHKDAQALADSVSLFVATGLRRGDAVIVVAPASRNNMYLAQLSKAERDTWTSSGQLALFDSQAMLNRIMLGGMPEWAEFRATLGPVIEKAKRCGGPNTRVYGEMVNDLWRAGNTAAAIQLEEYWNQLARIYKFCLFCGYQMDSLDERSYSTPLADIGRTHSDIIESLDDESIFRALDVASGDILGIPVSRVMSCNECRHDEGEQKLSQGQQAMLWLQKNMPNSIPQILARAREIYGAKPDRDLTIQPNDVFST